MSGEEDKESKTEEASEKKIQDALEKGQTPTSREVSVLFTFLVVLLLTANILPERVAAATTALYGLLDHSSEISLSSSSDLNAVWRAAGGIGLGVVLPCFVALGLAGLAGAFVQSPPAVIWTRVKPEWSRISFSKGRERIFSIKGFVEFLKAIAKIGFAVVIILFVSDDISGVLISSLYIDELTFLSMLQSQTVKIIAAITVSMIIVAGFDLFWSRTQWRKDLMMSKQEVKDELKQSLGDPIIKSRQRSVALARSRNRMMLAVPDATVVVMNPTHYSVALRYRQGQDEAPVVVAMGRDLIALRIRTIAEAANVPIVENVALARSLYKSVRLDQPIPQEFFQAVAQILSVLRKKSEKAHARQQSI